MSDQKTRTLIVDERISLTCPCGQSLAFGFDQHGAPIGVHSPPMCRDYAEKPLEEFITWVRRSYERRARA